MEMFLEFWLYNADEYKAHILNNDASEIVHLELVTSHKLSRLVTVVADAHSHLYCTYIPGIHVLDGLLHVLALLVIVTCFQTKW